jgi:hypothetical protein
VVHAVYKSSHNFIVTALDANNERVDGLVNAIGAYEGTVPLDFLKGQNTVRLQVQASGPWHIEVRPISSLATFDATAQGHGDDVVSYTGKAGIAAFTHSGEHNFIVDAYTSQRTGLVNEIGAYSGKVPVTAGPAVWTVQADGDWTVAIS